MVLGVSIHLTWVIKLIVQQQPPLPVNNTSLWMYNTLVEQIVPQIRTFI
jgi:hypothetical protein